jgi:protein-tyrosine phosphatase
MRTPMSRQDLVMRLFCSSPKLSRPKGGTVESHPSIAMSGSGEARKEDSSSTKILFVCTGNICRSAFAELYLRSVLGSLPYDSDVEVRSAGTMAVVDAPIDPEMSAEAERRGIVPRAHRARQLTGRSLRDADAVMVFEAEHIEWIGAEYPEYLEKVVGLGQAARILRKRPSRAVSSWSALAGDVRALSSELLAVDEIADPYGRGRAAAAQAAVRICRDIDALCCGLVGRA